MYKRHLALTERCPHRCTDSEHVYHLFWECSVAKQVWGLFFPSVSQNRLLPRSSLTAESVLYGPRGGCKTTKLQRQWRIINTVKQVLWEARNIKVYQKHQWTWSLSGGGHITSSGMALWWTFSKTSIWRERNGGWTIGRN
ncbi:hypothetical protein SKAU_G00288010 [Synaphobranchus kaupii]|uniref:Reverse transcriptase zinc-binding domain-containing protein n=1 Tax=Synaphobranchus kaupii TaxID=118154 RepID=A0A9Q1EYH2_SYNKA|nr:hypothetical protein SKAU_G00288010 [Synaphobranchus kaupii]